MDYEKKYNEAIKRAKTAIELAADKDLVKGVATTIFPELRESDDERIINQLITLVNSTGEVLLIPTNKEELIAWLEKQKEPKLLNNEKYQTVPIEILDRLYASEQELKEIKRKEQKPANLNLTTWHRDVVYCAMCDKNLDEGLRCNLEVVYKTIKDIVDRTPVVKEQKPADLPAGFYVTLDGKKYYTKEIRCKGMNVKVVEPKPAEWSEEDEKMIERLITRLNWITYNTRTDGTSPNITFFDEIAWLKSLRPSWRPSEEQMTNLLRAEARLRIEGESVLASKLAELYEQLKKLKGGVAPMRDIDE